MISLDDEGAIKKIDLSHSLESISLLPEQCEEAWYEVGRLPLPEYKDISSVLFCGMGGSAFGGRIIKSVYADELSVPIDVISDYRLPQYVDSRVLIIAASYSGNTEETISCVKQALNLNTKIVGISSGGELTEILTRNAKPVYTFIPKYNPSMQPRLGQGYMLVGQIGILKAIGLLKLTDKEITDVVDNLRVKKEALEITIPMAHNLAKKIAGKLKDKIVVIIGGEFLEGGVHAIRNSIHETGKHFADFFLLPEANHHLLEGLSFPKGNKDNLVFLLVNSDLYSEPVKKRFRLTRQVIEQNPIETIEINLTARTKLGQTFELIQIGSYITFYLAMLHEVDPGKIPWVDYFKEKLRGE